MQLEQVGERRHGLAVRTQFEAIEPGHAAREVRFQVLVRLVGLAALLVRHAQGRDGGDDDADARADVDRPDPGEVGHVEDRDAALEGFVERFPVRMARIAEGVQRLRLDLGSRHHPHHERKLAIEEVAASRLDDVRAHDRLAAAGGNPQAGVGHVRQSGHGLVGGWKALVDGCREGGSRIAESRCLEETRKALERASLVTLERQGHVSAP